MCWLLPIDKMCRSVFSHPLDSFPVSSKRNNLVNPSGNKSLTEGSSYAVTGHSIGGQSLCDFRISSLSLSVASRMQSFAPSSYAKRHYITNFHCCIINQSALKLSIVYRSAESYGRPISLFKFRFQISISIGVISVIS